MIRALWVAWLISWFSAARWSYRTEARLRIATQLGSRAAKANHRIVDSSPYALVRHPIYSEILLTVLATAAAMGTVLGVAGFVLIRLGCVLNGQLEERWLACEFPQGLLFDVS